MAFSSFINTQATQFNRRVTFQTFFVRKTLFLAKAVEFRFILKISYSHFIIRQATIGKQLSRIRI